MVRQTFYEDIKREEDREEAQRKKIEEAQKKAEEKGLSFKGFLKTIALSIAGNEEQLQADLAGGHAFYNQAEGSTTNMEKAEIGMTILGALIGGRGAKTGEARAQAAIEVDRATARGRRIGAYRDMLARRIDAEKSTGRSRMKDLTPEDIYKTHEELFGLEPGTSEFRSKLYSKGIDAILDEVNTKDVPKRNAFVKKFLKAEKEFLEAERDSAVWNDRKARIQESINDIDFELQGFDAINNAYRAAEIRGELAKIDKELGETYDSATLSREQRVAKLTELENKRQKLNAEFEEANQSSNQQYAAMERLHRDYIQETYQNELNQRQAARGQQPRSQFDDMEAYKAETGENPQFDLDTEKGRSDWNEWRKNYHDRLETDPEVRKRDPRSKRERDREFEEEEEKADFDEEEEKADDDPDDWFDTNVGEEHYDEGTGVVDEAHERWYDALDGTETESPELSIIEEIRKGEVDDFNSFEPADIDPADAGVAEASRQAQRFDINNKKQVEQFERERLTRFTERYGDDAYAEMRDSGILRGVYDLIKRNADESLEAYNRRINALKNKVRSTANFLLDKEGELMVARYNNMNQRGKDAPEQPPVGEKPVVPAEPVPGKPPVDGAAGPLGPIVKELPKVVAATVPESTDEQGGAFSGTGKMAVRQILDRVNLDELLEKCLDLSMDTYKSELLSSPEAFPNVNMYMNNRIDANNFNVPFLIYTEGSEMFVAFRGTSTLANIVTDISTSALGKNLPNRIADYDFPIEQHAGRLEVHAGFLKAVHEVYSFLISRIKKVPVISQVHFTGHSLGGAVANLCAYIYASDTDMSLPNLGYAVSFGAPRMLFDNEDYKNDYMTAVPKCIRVWNTRDPVPYLPFKKPVLIDFFGTRMASRFTHVGKSFDLTSNQVNCNINVLLYLILMGNKGKVKTLLEKVPTYEANRLLDFMVTKDFQTLLLQGFFTCADRVSVNKGYTQEDIDFIMEQLQNSVENLGSYDQKCERLRPYGLSDMMKLNNITDDVQEENFCIPAMMGLCVGANKTMTDAHRASYYKQKLNELIDRQAAEQKFIYEVADEDHEVFIPTNDESVKELAETTQTKFERKLSMVRGLVYVDQKEMQMLNGQVIVY